MFISLYITVLHTSHILVSYKYISFVAQLYIVRLDFVAVGNMCVTNSQTIAPVHLYFHPEVRTHAPTINVISPRYAPYVPLYHLCMYTFMIRNVLGLQYFGGYISNLQRYSPPRTLIRILALRDLWTGRPSSFWNFLRQHCSR